MKDQRFPRSFASDMQTDEQLNTNTLLNAIWFQCLWK